jgi:LDH2 family malate/lactate/ureidoglycolate dehydrogenase
MATLNQSEAVDLVAGALRSWGATAKTAHTVAEHLVDSDLSGHPSHGTRQMIRYRDLIDRGECEIGAEPVVVRSDGVLIEVDGRRGLGHPAMALAIDSGVSAALDQGAAVVSVVQCGHTGRMGAWAERAARQGAATMMVLAASDPPFVLAAAPGTAPALQTNPLTIGIPTSDEPLILDMATSAVAGGKVMVARAEGTTLPEGVLIDGLGQPSVNPEDFFNGGALLPAAGHKGFGLGTVIEALSVCLTAADAPGRRPTSGALIVCIRVEAFRPRDEFDRSVDQLRDRIRSSGLGRPVLLPGEPERTARHGRIEVEVGDDVLSLLAQAQPTSG